MFKDELRKMLPHDDDAARLAGNAYHFAEFFEAFDIRPPTLNGRAILWGHCHHRATGGICAEQRLLERMGLEVAAVDGGCCGLAGSSGFEAGKYDISMQCGEQALLPAVRAADRDTLIVADGFSCKTQIADAGTGRRAVHTAGVIALAKRRESDPAGEPVDRTTPPLSRRIVRSVAVLAPAATIAATIGTGAVRAIRGR